MGMEVVRRGFPWGLIKLAGRALCRRLVPSNLRGSTVLVSFKAITPWYLMFPVISQNQ